MKPSIAINEKKDIVRGAAARYKADNVRIFGSALRSADHEGSDLDLLVDAQLGATLFDLGGLQAELEDILGIRVDLVTPKDLPPKLRRKVIAEAKPL